MDANHNPSLMIWHAKPDMSCEYVNQAWREFTGYTLEEARGGGWYRALHPDDLTRWLGELGSKNSGCFFSSSINSRRSASYF